MRQSTVTEEVLSSGFTMESTLCEVRNGPQRSLYEHLSRAPVMTVSGPGWRPIGLESKGRGSRMGTRMGKGCTIAEVEMGNTKNPEVTRIHHIGVTVNDVEKATDEWSRLFGCEGRVVDIPENNIKIGVIEVVGVTFFLNQHTDPERKAQLTEGLELPVNFSGHQVVNGVGEGISHISFETTDLDAMMGKAEEIGLRARLDEHRDALEGVCNFIKPEDAHIPLEFMQPVEGKDNPLE